MLWKIDFLYQRKTLSAREKLRKVVQLNDVSAYNEEFLRIVLDIPNISMEERIGRYTRGLKDFIWKEICTKEYESINDAMGEAERVESACRRITYPAMENNRQRPFCFTQPRISETRTNVHRQHTAPPTNHARTRWTQKERLMLPLPVTPSYG